MLAYEVPVGQEQALAWAKRSRLATLTGWRALQSLSPDKSILAQAGWTRATSGTPRQTDEGWTYFPPARTPALADLLRARRPETAELTLDSGDVIHVPLAQMAPRRVLFSPIGGVRLGSAHGAWARQAWNIWLTRREEADAAGKRRYVITADDAEIGQAVFGGLSEVYAVTHELMNDALQLGSADFWRVLYAMWGYDPKALAGGGGASPSLPAESTDESHSPQPKRSA